MVLNWLDLNMVICLESYSLLLSENKNASESQVTPKLPHRKEGSLWRNPNTLKLSHV